MVDKKNIWIYKFRYAIIACILAIIFYAIMNPKEINGHFTQWSDWSECDEACGDGFKYRTRTYIPAENGGIDLSLDERDKIKEITDCKIKDCPIDGKFSEWTEWSKCDKDCGGGTMERTRTYTPALYGGNDLENKDHLLEKLTCNEQPCKVNGYFTEWSEWSKCSKDCGGGIMERSRLYIPARYGGVDLSLDERNKIIETKVCGEIPCKVDGHYSAWSFWSSCSKPCGGGEQTRHRYYFPAAHGGVDLEITNDTTQTQECNLHKCPVPEHTVFLKDGDRYDGTTHLVISPNSKYLLRYQGGTSWFIISQKTDLGGWEPISTLSVSSNKSILSVTAGANNIALISNTGALTIAQNDKKAYSAITNDGYWIFVNDDNTYSVILKPEEKIVLNW